MDIILLGAGGHAKDFIKNIEEFNRDVPKKARLNIRLLIDDYNNSSTKHMLAGYPVMHSLKVLSRPEFKKAAVMCAVGDPVNKKAFINKSGIYRLKYANFVHPSVSIHRTTKLGVGVSIFASSVISAFTEIGSHVSVNYFVSVSHDCKIGDYSTLCPGVNIGGYSTAKEGSFMGIGSCCLDRKTIGRWSVVGAGSTVTNDVKDFCIVAGNPGKFIAKRKEGMPVF